MTLVLIAAMAVSFGTMDWVSGGVIAALVVLNVGVGTINEYKAEKVSTEPSRYFDCQDFKKYTLTVCNVLTSIDCRRS